MGDTTYNVNVSKSEFHDNAAVIRNETRAAESDETAKILQELQKAREQLEKTEPLIANAVSDLEKAVKAKDKPSIAKFAGGLLTGTTKAVFAKVASDALLTWLKSWIP